MDVSDVLIFFLFLGGGKGGGVRGVAGGAGSSKYRGRGGGVIRGGGGAGEGRAPGKCLWGGGGAKYFFWGRNAHQDKLFSLCSIEITAIS